MCLTGDWHPRILELTPGQAADAPYALDLVALVRRLRAQVVIPPAARRTHQRYSRRLYRGRNVVERFWAKVNQYRRAATRYDKLDTSYLAFVHLAAVLVVLRHP